MAPEEQNTPGSDERTEIEPRHEADIFGKYSVSVAESHLSLGNGGISLLAAKRWIARIFQVDIAVISHRQILDNQVVAVEIEHREITDGALRLSPVGSKDDISGIRADSEQLQTLAANSQSHRSTPALAFSDLGIIWIVNPVHPGCDVHFHRV